MRPSKILQAMCCRLGVRFRQVYDAVTHRKSRPALGVLVVFFFLIIANRYNAIFLAGIRVTVAHLWRDFRVFSVIPCSAIRFRDFTEHRADFDYVWQGHFNNSQVQRFRADYLESCARRKLSFTVSINEKPSSCWGCQTRGLTNAINIALSMFLVTQASSPPRQFRLAGDAWNYGSWREHFVDFTEREPRCTLTAWNPSTDDEIYNDIPIQVMKNETVFFAGAPDHILLKLNANPFYGEIYDGAKQYEARRGDLKIFAAKSVAAQALMDPQPHIKSLIRSIWSQLTSGGKGYIFIHIRRGDKVPWEGPLFPVSLYHRTLKRMCFRTANCSRTVFLMSDDPAAAAEFRRSVGDCFHVTDYQRELTTVPAGRNWTVAQVVHTNQNTFDAYSKEQRILHAREFLVSIFLSALADTVICTYSSNVCRLIALIRGGHLADNGIVSLDWPTWVT